MLDSVIRLSLRFRFLVIVVALILLLYGSYLTTTMTVDVFPDLDRPRVILLTECPGLATEEVETLVTQPIEVALLGANGVEAVRSQSTAGLSVIYIEFGWEVEIREALQTVQERLATLAGILPQGIVPQLTPTSSSMGQIVIAGMYFQKGPSGGQLAPVGDTKFLAELIDANGAEPRVQIWQPSDRRDPTTWKPIDAPVTPQDDGRQNFKVTINERTQTIQFQDDLHRSLELGTLGDWGVRPRLLKVRSVAEVFIQGADRKQYQVLVNPQALLDYGVTLQDVEQALASSNLNTSGGYAITGESERPIRILERIGPTGPRVMSDLSKVPVKITDARPILLGDVASIVEGAEVKRGDGAIDGHSGQVFTLVKQLHVDTRRLTDNIEEALKAVESSLPAHVGDH